MIAEAAIKPYKGPDSYQAEDARLFFGRDAEADQLVAKIVSSRFTLLHAPSGAGKTSLLNARVIPGLQSRSWLPIRILPQNDPVQSIRLTSLQALFPPLPLEVDAMRAAAEALGGSEALTIAGLLERYDALDVKAPGYRTLVRTRTASPEVVGARFQDPVSFDPVFCRLLRGNIECAQMAEHFGAVASLGGEAPMAVAITDDTPVVELIRIVESIDARVSYPEILDLFDQPSSDLCAFFENVATQYGRYLTRFRIVLVLDQFEELFTRFVDLGAVESELPEAVRPLDWRLRWSLFEELQRLYVGPGTGPLPIRFVVSMRDEFIAQLDPLRAFIPDLDGSAYHLALLGTDAAREAIAKPALEFGYRYSDLCFEMIVDQLTKEQRFVEPTHLQIVCEKLWFRRGLQLSNLSADTDSKPPIEVEELIALDGASGILRSFLREFLEALPREAHIEVLEMLELLVTSGGARNIVEVGQLIRPRYRKAPLRERLLRELQQRTIVRVEPRLGGQFAEITHEFLIGPVLQALREARQLSHDYGLIRRIPHLLGSFDGVDLRRSTGLLNEPDFQVLHQLRHDIRWEAWSVELMLRSAIVLGLAGSAVEHWGQQYESYFWNVEELLEDPRSAARLMTVDELRALSVLEGPFDDMLSARILRSVVTCGVHVDRKEIAAWVERLIQHE
jgi:hypothetical protein